MKMKLAKYAAKLLVENGITQCFSVTGGGAMHLNDGLGHEPGMTTLYMHHEQSCAIAAESYARIYNKPACLCVTTGPGGTNAITGVLGAWLDSIPMIVLSGQVRYDNTARWSNVGIRAMGDQEFDITRSIDCMTKYSKMLLDPEMIRYELEKCIYLSQTGRPGPCWLDIPVDLQGMQIETDGLLGFDIEAYEEACGKRAAVIDEEIDRLKKRFEEAETGKEGKQNLPLPEKENLLLDADEKTADMGARELLLSLNYAKQKWQRKPKRLTKDSAVIDEIIARVRASERPVFYTGNGIRIAGAEDVFLRVADRLGIPVVVSWNGVDIIPSGHPLKAGQPGGRGDRPGNFAVQNADLILSVGSRLNIRQVGYNFKTWARAAYTIVCDIDEEELKKPSVHIDVAVHADAANLLECLDERLSELGYRGHGANYKNTKRLSESGYGRKSDIFKEAERNAWVGHEEALSNQSGHPFVFDGGKGIGEKTWLETCAYWMERYSVYQKKYGEQSADAPVNVYELIHRLSSALSEEQITVVGNGSACVAGGQAYVIKDGTRFISQDAVASMGYDLPAAIGACIATHDVCGKTEQPDYETKTEKTTASENRGSELLQKEKDRLHVEKELETAKKNPCWKGEKEQYPAYYAHDIICPTGDGSIMMNLQELQTIVSHKMPIKIFLINNGGYHSIRQTQHNLFAGEPLVGIGVDSYDLSFPDFKRVAEAFGIAYERAAHNNELEEAIQKTLSQKGPVICEVFVSMEQAFEPRSAVKKHPDGSLSSPPLEDLCPFLSPEELKENMLI